MNIFKLMSIITLTTDLGYRDPYLAIVKACLHSKIENPSIIDLSCDIKDNTITDAAYILKTTIPFFPKGTIHLVGVKFIVSKGLLNKKNEVDNTRYLLAEYQNQYIITPDNGILTLLDSNFANPVYQLIYDDVSQHRFFLKDIFVNVAAHLVANHPLSDIAIETQEYYKAFQLESFASPDNIKGKNIYVDDFGNIITNITKQQFLDAQKNRAFSIVLPGVRISKISNTYDDVKFGDALALFNSFGYLEIALNGGSAFKLMHPREIGRTFDFNLTIDFYD